MGKKFAELGGAGPDVNRLLRGSQSGRPGDPSVAVASSRTENGHGVRLGGHHEVIPQVILDVHRKRLTQRVISIIDGVALSSS